MKTKKSKFKNKKEESDEQGKRKEAYKRSKNRFRTPQELQNYLRQADEEEMGGDYWDSKEIY